MNILHQRRKLKRANENWCVYSHFDKNGNVELYVLNALKRLKASGFRIFLVSTSPSIDDKHLLKLKRSADIIAIRENVGYDFGSYKLGIQFLSSSNITPKQLLITNDSVFGPIFDLSSVINKSRGFDLYGMTDSIDHAYHLQSYFIIYNSRVLKSKYFTDFWNSVELLDSSTPDFKNVIIQNYEVGGTQFFIRNGFRVGSAFGIDQIIKNHLNRFLTQVETAKSTSNFQLREFVIGHNPTHSYWEDLINIGFPYIKRELLTKNPTNSPLENWATVIDESRSYNVKWIIDALINHFGNRDFLYTNQTPSNIANLLRSSGSITLQLSQQFKKWRNLYALPASKKFVFDSDYYLSMNVDVKAAIDRGDKINPVSHFIQHGHSENRLFKLHPLGVNKN